MADINTNLNNLRPSKPFGFNVAVAEHIIPQRTIEEISKTISEGAAAASGVSGIFDYLAKNEKVFDGSVQRELESLAVQEFNTNQILNNASPANGSRFNFDF